MKAISPIAKKLHIKPNAAWLFLNAPQNYLAAMEPLPDGAQAKFVAEGSFDGIQLFVMNSADLPAALQEISHLLQPDTILWITYPKKSSGVASDLAMMGSWSEPARLGLRTVASAAIDDTWTALRFRPEGQSKISESRNDAIKQNEYAAYIDVDNKQVLLPPDVKQVLEQVPNALAFFETLSYSNKKEYIVWILSAKQETTKQDRLNKMVQKLAEGKKNPSAS